MEMGSMKKKQQLVALLPDHSSLGSLVPRPFFSWQPCSQTIPSLVPRPFLSWDISPTIPGRRGLYYDTPLPLPGLSHTTQSSVRNLDPFHFPFLLSVLPPKTQWVLRIPLHANNSFCLTSSLSLSNNTIQQNKVCSVHVGICLMVTMIFLTE